jgi:hypothetical protein
MTLSLVEFYAKGVAGDKIDSRRSHDPTDAALWQDVGATKNGAGATMAPTDANCPP